MSTISPPGQTEFLRNLKISTVILTLIPASSAGDPGATESIFANGVSFADD